MKLVRTMEEFCAGTKGPTLLTVGAEVFYNGRKMWVTRLSKNLVTMED